MIAALLPVDHFVIMTRRRAASRRSSPCSGGRERGPRWKLFGVLLASLLLGGLAVAWLMYPFPS